MDTSIAVTNYVGNTFSAGYGLIRALFMSMFRTVFTRKLGFISCVSKYENMTMSHVLVCYVNVSKNPCIDKMETQNMAISA